MSELEHDRLTMQVKTRGEPFKILIVDDEQWVREVFKDFCDLTDVLDVDIAVGGADAIDKVRDKKYDLVTMDLIMPEVSGLEALSEIKRVSPSLPIVVITGNATDKLINQAGVLGACKVMYKPIRLEEFLSEVTSALVS